MRALLVVAVLLLALWSSGCERSSAAEGGGKTPGSPKPAATPATTQAAGDVGKVEKTDAEWRKILSPTQYRILRQKDTERAFTGEFWNNHAKGVYVCAGCGQELFVSDTKFDSGCGWPSFFQAIAPNRVKEQVDKSHGMVRTEILCARCGGHLGHVFTDGPRDKTGLRYCINSGAMKFVKIEDAKKPDSPKKPEGQKKPAQP